MLSIPIKDWPNGAEKEQFTPHFTSNHTSVTGVIPVGGDILAPAVSKSLAVIVFMYSADPSEDAAGCVPATGSTMVLEGTIDTYRLTSLHFCRLFCAFVLLRECWERRTSARCISSQSKTSMETPCLSSWRTWTPVPTWMGSAGHRYVNSSFSASPSPPPKSPLLWTCSSSHSMWVTQNRKSAQLLNAAYFWGRLKQPPHQ